MPTSALEIRDPPLIRPGRGAPVAFDQVRVTDRLRVAGGSDRLMLAAPHTFDAENPHQPGDLVPADGDTRPERSDPQLLRPVNAPVRYPQVIQPVSHARVVVVGGGNEPLRSAGIVGARGDRHPVQVEHSAYRLDPETFLNLSI